MIYYFFDSYYKFNIEYDFINSIELLNNYKQNSILDIANNIYINNVDILNLEMIADYSTTQIVDYNFENLLTNTVDVVYDSLLSIYTDNQYNIENNLSLSKHDIFNIDNQTLLIIPNIYNIDIITNNTFNYIFNINYYEKSFDRNFQYTILSDIQFEYIHTICYDFDGSTEEVVYDNYWLLDPRIYSWSLDVISREYILSITNTIWVLPPRQTIWSLSIKENFTLVDKNFIWNLSSRNLKWILPNLI